MRYLLPETGLFRQLFGIGVGIRHQTFLPHTIDQETLFRRMQQIAFVIIRTGAFRIAQQNAEIMQDFAHMK